MRSLIERILDGDEEVIAQFYRDYSPKILRYLRKKLPENDAKEIVNDVFLDAIDALPSLQKQNNISPFLYRIAHNKMVNFYRKRKIKSVLLSQISLLAVIAKEILQPEFQMEKNELRDKIESSLHDISRNYREILRMHYEDQIPVKEIARILGLSPKATESRLFRARQRFIKSYERA